MIIATEKILTEYDKISEKRQREILKNSDDLIISGDVYYVSNLGSDENDGKSPETAWKTLDKVSSAFLKPNDGVLFRRGDLFRGKISVKDGVTYGAFGKGEKPKFYGWNKNLADETLWTTIDKTHNVWKMKEKILDVGTLVFNQGETHSVKLIPSYINGRFVCRYDEKKTFDIASEMIRDLDLYWSFDADLTKIPSRGQNFPVPKIDDNSYGYLYLRCDKGNPGKVFSSIEALPRRNMFDVGTANNVRIDNICIKFVGAHAIGAAGKQIRGLKITNCEIGWIGGTIQHYLGTDPNYPQGGRGTVTRFGNGVEVYGGCKDYEVSNCYIYQVYDAAITHQITTFGKKYVAENVTYKNNLIERCVYSIEYFLDMTDGDTESYMDGIEISGNILRFSGFGWGQQRHNVHTPAHIKSWSYENRARNYRVTDNIFDRAAYAMLQLEAKEIESCPYLNGNTFIQYIGGNIGRFGENAESDFENVVFDEYADFKIQNIFGDKNPVVIGIKQD